MPVLKLLNRPYYGEDTLHNVIDYVIRGSCLVGGVAIDPDLSELQMRLVKRAWHKEEGRQVRHFILGFEDVSYERHGLEEFYEMAEQIARYYGCRYQLLFGIHDNSDHIHIHFVLNTVSCMDGKMYREGYHDAFELKRHVESVLGLPITLVTE